MTTLNLVYETALSIPFKIGNTGNVSTTVDLSKIWGDRVLAAVGTLKKEKLLSSTYGSEVPLHTMDPMRTVEELIYADVSAVFARHLSVLQLVDVSTTVNSDEGTINLDITYQLPTNETTTTQIGFASINSSGTLTETPR